MGLVVWVCHVCVCACGCVCAGIDYKRRSLEINGKQLRLSIWYVFVCSCLCVQRERVGCWIWGCSQACVQAMSLYWLTFLE